MRPQQEKCAHDRDIHIAEVARIHDNGDAEEESFRAYGSFLVEFFPLRQVSRRGGSRFAAASAEADRKRVPPEEGN